MHILVIEPSPERAAAVQSALAGAGHHPEVVGTGSGALIALARPAPPDLVLLQVELPDMPALDLLQAAEGMGLHAPVVVLGAEAVGGRWIEATRLGAVDFVHTDDEGGYLATLAARLQTAVDRVAAGDQAQRLADALASTAAAVRIVVVMGRS